MAELAFQERVTSLLQKHDGSALAERWDEANAFGSSTEVFTSWIRETDDLINIVWLTPDGIKDITWFPAFQRAMFNFLPLRSINAFEVREGKDIGMAFGYSVEGDYIIRALTTPQTAILVWIAATAQQQQDLKAFYKVLMTHYVTTR